MKILLIIIVVIISIAIVLSFTPFKVNAHADLLKFDIKVFGLSVFKKKDQALYDFIIPKLMKVKVEESDSSMPKELLKAIKIKDVTFVYGGDAPGYGMLLGFLNIVTSLLRFTDFRDALYLKYNKGDMHSFDINFSFRLISVLRHFLIGKRKKARKHGQKARR